VNRGGGDVENCGSRVASCPVIGAPSSVFAVEVDGVAPFAGVASREVLGGEGAEIVPVRSSVVVNHIEDDAQVQRVRAIHESSDGTLWIGTHSGLSRVRESGDTIRFDHPLAVGLGTRPVPVVFSIAESPPGLLWLGTDAGVMRFDPSAGKSRTLSAGRTYRFGPNVNGQSRTPARAEKIGSVSTGAGS